MQSNSAQHGPAWTFYSDIWLGRAVCKDTRTGHVRTVPHRDPSQAMHEVCTVLWDNAPWQPEDIPVSTLRSYLMPMFVKDPVLVPPKVLQLQSNNWCLQNANLSTSVGHVQAAAATPTHQTADEGSMQQSHISGHGRNSHSSGSSIASNCCTPTKPPAVQEEAWQDIAMGSPHLEALAGKVLTLVDEPAKADGQAQGALRCISGLPAAWLQQLVRQYLEPSDRLHLFQTNTAMAVVIMHHTAKPTLSLTPRLSDSAASIEKLKSVQNIKKLLAILAHKKLHLQAGRLSFSCSTTRFLFNAVQKHNVTQLTLSEMVLEPTHLILMKTFTNLSLLTFGPDLQFNRTCRRDMAQLSDLESWFPASCTKLQLHQEGSSSCVQHLLPLLAPHITHFVVKPAASQQSSASKLSGLGSSDLSRFTALTHVALPWSLKGGEPHLGVLVSMSTLTHVDIGGLDGDLTSDNGSSDETEANSQLMLDVNWQQLVIREYCWLGSLMQLPLERIQHVVIDGELYPKIHWSTKITDHHIAHLAKCQKLQFMPCSEYSFTGYRWHAKEDLCTPEHLCLSVARPAGQYTPAFVKVCMRSLVGGLMLPDLSERIVDDAVFVDLIRHLPPTVDAVLLRNLVLRDDRAHSCEQLAAALPVYVKRLIMEHLEDGRELCRNAALIAKHLETTGHPAVLYVLLAPHHLVLDGLQQAVAAYPSKVRVIIGKADHRWSRTNSRPEHGFHDIWQD